jgi:hypothetical protein
MPQPNPYRAADEDPVSVVKRCYQAYIDNDRVAIEALIATDFHFSSPRDNRLDRTTYFARCWPASEHITDFKLLHLMPDGECVFITYQGSLDGRPGLQNTEILTVRNGQLVEAEVYFGWSLPHKTPASGFID